MGAARTARKLRGIALPAKGRLRAPIGRATKAALSLPGLLPNWLVSAHCREAFADRRKRDPYAARAELLQRQRHRHGGARTRVEVALQPACPDPPLPPIPPFPPRPNPNAPL